MGVELKNISKKMGNRYIIRNFTYVFDIGRSYMLCGKNGSGKTTLLKCISSLYLPDEGNLVFDDIVLKNNQQYLSYRNNISYFEGASKFLISNLTVLQNIKFFLGIDCISYKKREKQVMKWINEFEISMYVDKIVSELSKGTQQKVALIIIFLKNKKIILLDEPYDGLDFNGITVMQKYIEENCKEKIIIYTSPNECNYIESKVINME